jgi:predicted O-methyltransferase YrrM
LQPPFELYALTRLLRPNHIVEVGVSAGVSSAYFLRAFERNGHGKLHSIDLPEPQIGSAFSLKKNSAWCLPLGRSSGWAVPSKLQDGWDLRLGRSGELLPELIGGIENCGLLLYDVPYTKASAIADFQVVNEKLKRGSVVLADNCLAPLT